MLDLDLDAVTVSQPRIPYACEGGDLCCDWAQDTETATLFLRVGPGARGRDIDVRLTVARLEVARRGVGRLLAGTLGGRCDPSEVEWELKGSELHITLRKAQQREWLVPLHPETTADAGETVRTASPPAAVPATAQAAQRTEPLPPPRATSASPAPVRLSEAGDRGQQRSRHGEHGGRSGDSLGAAYESWDRFDELDALAAVENDGKSADEPGWSLRASSGVAAVQCTEYVKDKEEISLDEELKEKRGALQASFNERMADAAELKQRGNELLRRGQPAEALSAYLEGDEALALLTEHGAVLLSARLAEASRSLRRDLRNNGAQAALKLGEWEEAVRLAGLVLEADAAQPKALFRRASALVARGAEGDAERARADLRALLNAQPGNQAAQQLATQLAMAE